MKYRYEFTSTIEDLLNAEDADTTLTTGARHWIRLSVTIIGIFILLTGLLSITARGWKALPPIVAGSFLIYYFIARSYFKRSRICRENSPSQELLLEFLDDHISITGIDCGCFKRTWKELLDIHDTSLGVLLYFDDGTVNWVPVRVFRNKSEKTAFVGFLKSHISFADDEDGTPYP